MRSYEITNKGPESFVSCRVGLELQTYQEDLTKVIEAHNIGDRANFIVTPIAPPRSIYYDSNLCDIKSPGQDELHLIPDLVAETQIWEQQVAVSIGHLPIYSDDNSHAISIFEKVLEHALYLPTPVILIDCPETLDAQRSVASIINKNLKTRYEDKLLLIRVPLVSEVSPRSPKNSSPSSSSKASVQTSNDITASKFDQTTPNGCSWDMLEDTTGDSGMGTPSKFSSSIPRTESQDGWNTWNSFRSLLEPDHRIGVCLVIGDDLETGSEDHVVRWTGEPIYMVTIGIDAFKSQEGFQRALQVVGKVREFMRCIALINSLKTSFVVQAKFDIDTKEHLECLADLCDSLHTTQRDNLRAWNDNLLCPLQPLSNNLSSLTYHTFESDRAKYIKYYQAMVEALRDLMKRKSPEEHRTSVVMVLGAGRGPLVDAMIKAIRAIDVREKNFKIYALDKNHSSIRSLKYKKVNNWDAHSPSIQVEIIEADMRAWDPAEKADIIATELLGSFSDNELSPECIDGTWRFATPETICIPQSYSSFITPICSYRMLQALHKSRFFANENNKYDKLRVVRLSNFYQISEPRELFTFYHHDISREPVTGANQRQATIRFHSSVDTVCHGFAGFFTARLYGSTYISTVPNLKTPNMESWFSAFIPIEKPIQMPESTCLEVIFHRKDSPDKVWYEWMVTKPEMTRVHSKDGNGSAMSKLI